jgi:hypothetical protein
MNRSLLIAIYVSATITAVQSLCPSLSALRTSYVSRSFDARLASGLFYENAYTDLAQIGARCQRMNKTATTALGVIIEDYSVFYGNLSFPLPLVYNATDTRAVFARYMALAPFLTFPSVVVDARLSADGSRYDALTEYLCWDVLGIDYVEVRLSTRWAEPPAGLLTDLEATARAQGVTWSGNLTAVTFADCPAFPSSERIIAAAAVPATVKLAARQSATRVQAAPLPVSVAARDAKDDLVIPGIKPGLPQLAFVFIQGAEVEPVAYEPLLRYVQSAVSDFDVYIAAPDAPLIHTPDPIFIESDVSRVLKKLVAAGLDLSTARVAFGAHSLGGLMVQDWLATANFSALGYEPEALVLTGAYVSRPNRPGVNSSAPTFRIPTLSVVGELDGLARVSRFAEAWWWQLQRETDPVRQANFPVLVVPGMTHGQWCHFDGPVPTEVATYDLTAEISEDAAHTAGAHLIGAYLSASLHGSQAAQNAAVIAAAQNASAIFLAPLVESLVYEASYNLVPPCYDAPPSPWCQIGSRFSEQAQQIMFNAAGANGSASYAFSATVVDAMHPVADLHPIHLGNITNHCVAPDSSCVLDASTVTENSYDPIFSQLDVALYPVSAHEIKMCD